MINGKLKIDVFPGQVQREGKTKAGESYVIQRVWCEGLFPGPVPVDAFINGSMAVPDGKYEIDFQSCADLRDGKFDFRINTGELNPVK